MEQAKTIIEFINTTLHGYKSVVADGSVPEEDTYKIISVILNRIEHNEPVLVEVLNYCREHYNYRIPTPTEDDINRIFSNIQRFGGSFDRTMGTALLIADAENKLKLVEEFGDLYAKYLSM